MQNPPANAGDIGLIPGLGRSHMQRGNCELQRLSLTLGLVKPARLKPAVCNKKSHHNEEHTHHDESLHSPQPEKARTATKTKCTQKYINKSIFLKILLFITSSSSEDSSSNTIDSLPVFPQLYFPPYYLLTLFLLTDTNSGHHPTSGNCWGSVIPFGCRIT